MKCQRSARCLLNIKRSPPHDPGLDLRVINTTERSPASVGFWTPPRSLISVPPRFLARFQLHAKETCIWKNREVFNGAELMVCLLEHFTGLGCSVSIFALWILRGHSVCLLMKISPFFLLLQKRWSGAASLGEAWDRLNATHRSRGKDYLMGCVWFFLTFPDLGLLFRHGRTGFRCSGASPVGARRPGAPSRLSDRSLRPQLRAACRSLPAGEILPLAHTNGSPLRSVKARLCGACHKGMQLVKCSFFPSFFGASLFVWHVQTFVFNISVWLRYFLKIYLKYKAC